jgi:hypothetical protein
MALIKSVPWKYGINATYWSVDQINISWSEDPIAHIGLFGYKDEESRTVLKESYLFSFSYDFGVNIDANEFPFHKDQDNGGEFERWLINKCSLEQGGYNQQYSEYEAALAEYLSIIEERKNNPDMEDTPLERPQPPVPIEERYSLFIGAVIA